MTTQKSCSVFEYLFSLYIYNPLSLKLCKKNLKKNSQFSPFKLCILGYLYFLPVWFLSTSFSSSIILHICIFFLYVYIESDYLKVGEGSNKRRRGLGEVDGGDFEALEVWGNTIRQWEVRAGVVADAIVVVVAGSEVVPVMRIITQFFIVIEVLFYKYFITKFHYYKLTYFLNIII